MRYDLRQAEIHYRPLGAHFMSVIWPSIIIDDNAAFFHALISRIHISFLRQSFNHE